MQKGTKNLSYEELESLKFSVSQQQYILGVIYEKLTPLFAKYLPAETIGLLDQHKKDSNKCRSTFEDVLGNPLRAFTPGVRNKAGQDFSQSVSQFKIKLFEQIYSLIRTYEWYKLNSKNIADLIKDVNELERFYEVDGQNTKSALPNHYLNEHLDKVITGFNALEEELVKQWKAKIEEDRELKANPCNNPVTIIKTLFEIKDHPTVIKVIALQSMVKYLDSKPMPFILKTHDKLRVLAKELNENYTKLQLAAILHRKDAFQAACTVCNQNTLRMAEVLLIGMYETLSMATDYYAIGVDDEQISRAIKRLDRAFLAIHAPACEAFQLKELLKDFIRQARLLLDDKIDVSMYSKRAVSKQTALNEHRKKFATALGLVTTNQKEEKTKATALEMSAFARAMHRLVKTYTVLVDRMITKEKTKHDEMLGVVTGPAESGPPVSRSGQTKPVKKEVLDALMQDPLMVQTAYTATRRQDPSKTTEERLIKFLEQKDYAAAAAYLFHMANADADQILKELCDKFPNHKESLVQAMDKKRIACILIYLKIPRRHQQIDESKGSLESKVDQAKPNFEAAAALLFCLKLEDRKRIFKQLNSQVNQEIIILIEQALPKIEKIHDDTVKELEMQSLNRNVNIKFAAKHIVKLTPEAQKELLFGPLLSKLYQGDMELFSQEIGYAALEQYCQVDCNSAAKQMIHWSSESRRLLEVMFNFGGMSPYFNLKQLTTATKVLEESITQKVQTVKATLGERDRENYQGATEQMSTYSPEERLHVWVKLRGSLTSSQTTRLLATMRDRGLVKFTFSPEPSALHSNPMRLTAS